MWSLFWMLGFACSIKKNTFESSPPVKSKKTQNGLSYQVLRKGKGELPSSSSQVTIRYKGWNQDGAPVDIGHSKRSISTFLISHSSLTWREGLSVVRQGGRYRFWLPEDWGDESFGDMVVFEVEILSFENPQFFLQAPKELKPPKDARRTKSGLSYKRIKKGKGKDSPNEGSIVTVHYTGWKNDGTRIDSSFVHGKSMSFPLQKVVAGWREGLQLMKQGEKTIFWIPQKLAYGPNPRPGAPEGDLIFMVELIAFENP